ncbi:MAG: M18 family aminopeptidase, partial [Muribaculaceae bacterium]|nr:M18 family aminopeptidase [Muribaculaceae bacterium]
MNPHTASLLRFLDNSPCNFLAVSNVADELDKAGFTRLEMADHWDLRPGGRYYVTQNDSAIFAFVAGTGAAEEGFRIVCAHSDSPGFRIKPAAEMTGKAPVLKLNTEVYGGPILYTWFDRPLSISGRVILRSDNPLRPSVRLVDFRRPLLTIPHLAIHYNRSVNEGNKLSKQKDMLPVLALLRDKAEADGYLLRLLAEETGAGEEEILDFDLTLYDTTPACLFGPSEEFISSGRIDDLAMVHAAVTSLTGSLDTDCAMTRVAAVFDNEETGSGTKQGAASPILRDILYRLTEALGGNGQDSFTRAVDNSFM